MILTLFFLTFSVSFIPSFALPSHPSSLAKRTETLEKGIIPLRRRPIKATKRRLTKRVGQNLRFTLADGNQEFVAQVTIGTPWTNLQTFDLPIDTASSDTWVASNSFTCEDYIDDCDPGTLYTPSSSFVPLNASLNTQYGDGEIAGQFGTDAVTIGGFIVPDAIIGVVNAGQWLFDGTTSGLLGLGGALLANLWYHGTENPTIYNPLLVQMYTEGIITPNFTLAFSQTGGYLSLGTVPLPSSVLHSPTWIATPMPPYSSGPPNGTIYAYYSIEVQALAFQTRQARNISYAYRNWMIVDSGTSANIFPDPVANALNELWDPQPDPYDGSMPCNISEYRRYPTLGVSIGNYTFWHDPQTLIASFENGGCSSAIMGTGSPPESPAVLGTPFWMNVVATFDLGAEVMWLSSTNLGQV